MAPYMICEQPQSNSSIMKEYVDTTAHIDFQKWHKRATFRIPMVIKNIIVFLMKIKTVWSRNFSPSNIKKRNSTLKKEYVCTRVVHMELKYFPAFRILEKMFKGTYTWIFTFWSFVSNERDVSKDFNLAIIYPPFLRKYMYRWLLYYTAKLRKLRLLKMESACFLDDERSYRRLWILYMLLLFCCCCKIFSLFLSSLDLETWNSVNM